jgi:hypothetical protein
MYYLRAVIPTLIPIVVPILIPIGPWMLDSRVMS